MKLQQKQTSSKNLGVAALKALRAYPESEVVKKKIEKWGKFVSAVSERYGKTRDKQQRTKREARNWPKDGYDAIRKLAERLGKEPVVQQALQKALVYGALETGALGDVCFLLASRPSRRPGGPSDSQKGKITCTRNRDAGTCTWAITRP